MKTRLLQATAPSSASRLACFGRGARRAHGSTLVITVILCGILGILMGSYLWFVRNQQLSVARSQRWHKAMVVAEAGVDEAMALLNDGMILSQPLPSQDVFRWKWTTTTTLTRTALSAAEKQQFDGSYYTVTVTMNDRANPTNPVITATGFVPVPYTTQIVSRVIQVVNKPKPAFPIKAPMIVVNSYDANGNNITADSFDSTLTNLFPGGIYNAANAMDQSEIVSLSTNKDAVHIGNASVKGKVRTPTGGVQGVTATVGSQGSVGDSTWVDGGHTGFQSGHFTDDVNLSFDSVVLPNLTWSTPMGGTVNTTNFTYVLNSSTPNYKINGSLGGTDRIYVNSTNTILYITGDVTINTEQVIIAPGASMSMYVGGANADIAGNGIVNGSGAAKSFTYYGLPSNTYLKFSGNAGFVGSIYAPDTIFSLGGGGNNTYDFSGASITKKTTMNGKFNFHFDNALLLLTRPNGYSAISWTEL